jgi:hypothetical protein
MKIHHYPPMIKQHDDFCFLHAAQVELNRIKTESIMLELRVQIWIKMDSCMSKING